MVTSVTVNHSKILDGEGYISVLITMVTAAVGNHGVENLQRMRSMQHATCACYVVKKTWRREDVIVAALTAFFRLQREPNLKSGRIVVFIRMLRTAGQGWQPAGAARRKSLRGAACHDPL